MKNKKGFTLIELIVVIAILGILALFLVPQFMGYANDAKMQVAEANTRTVWSAASSELALKNFDPQSEWEEFYDAVGERLGSSFSTVSISYDVELDSTNGSLARVMFENADTYCETSDGVDITCIPK